MAEIKTYRRDLTGGWGVTNGRYPCVVERLTARQAYIRVYSAKRNAWDTHRVQRGSLLAPTEAERRMVERQLAAAPIDTEAPAAKPTAAFTIHVEGVPLGVTLAPIQPGAKKPRPSKRDREAIERATARLVRSMRKENDGA